MFASWNPAMTTSTMAPGMTVTYRIYMEKGILAPTAFGVTSSSFVSQISKTSVDLYNDYTNITKLEYGQAYSVVVRAIDTNEYESVAGLSATVLSASTKTLSAVDTDVVFPFEVQFPYTEDVIFHTLISQFESGKEQRRGIWLKPLRSWKVSLSVLERNDIATLWDFYIARKGALQTFIFNDLNDDPITDEAIDGLGVGLTYSGFLAEPLIKRSSVSMAIGNTSSAIIDTGVGGFTMGSSPVVDVVSSSLNYETGQFSLVVGTPPGAAISAGYSKQHRVRFESDVLTKKLFAYRLYNNNLGLVEIK